MKEALDLFEVAPPFEQATLASDLGFLIAEVRPWMEAAESCSQYCVCWAVGHLLERLKP